MSTNDDISTSGPLDTAQPGIDVQFKAIAERVAKTADSDLKAFLAGILKTTETTLTDLKSMRERLDKAQADADAAAAAARIAKKDASETAVRADIRSEAQAAGALDAADVLPFINVNEIKVNKEGKSNIIELIGALKKSKPYLFGKASTSAAHPAPKPGNSTSKNALEMTPTEYRAAKTRFTRR